MTLVLGETRVALCCRSCRRSCGPCLVLGFLQGVAACAHILLVVLHLVCRVGVGSPLRIQRDVCSDRISIERPNGGQARIFVPSAKTVPGFGRDSRRCADFRSVPYFCQVGHRTASVLFKAHRVHISVIVELQHQRPIGCHRPTGDP